MSILVPELEIRKIIRSSIIKEEGFLRGARRSGEGNVSVRRSKGEYEGPLVTVKNGKKYIGDPSIGLSPPGFWDDFRKRLDKHIKTAYPGLGMRIDNLGVTRDLEQAADAGGNSARVSGSKHGCGMAQDVKMHTEHYGNYNSFATMNPRLAKNKKLVNAIIDFMAKPENSDLVWGGAFGSGSSVLQKDTLPTGRGITEFHHFEFKGSKIPSFFSKYESELAKLGMKSSQLTNTRSLKELYQALVSPMIS